MKKTVYFGVLLVGSVLLMTGCGNRQELKCTIDLKNDDVGRIEYSFYFDEKGNQDREYEYMVYDGNNNIKSALFKGDIVPYVLRDKSDLEIDDLVGFKDSDGSDGFILVHRILDKVENDGIEAFVTKDDESTTVDNDLLNVDEALFTANEIENLYSLSYKDVKKEMKSIGYTCK